MAANANAAVIAVFFIILAPLTGLSGSKVRLAVLRDSLNLHTNCPALRLIVNHCQAQYNRSYPVFCANKRLSLNEKAASVSRDGFVGHGDGELFSRHQWLLSMPIINNTHH
jgi:hypothetical protein